MKTMQANVLLLNGRVLQVLSEAQVKEILPCLVRGIGMIPYGPTNVCHFRGYQVPLSADQMIGSNTPEDCQDDAISAVQYQIDQAYQPLEESHLIINYYPDSIWVDLVSCKPFDVQTAIDQIMELLLIEEVTWKLAFHRPL